MTALAARFGRAKLVSQREVSEETAMIALPPARS